MSNGKSYTDAVLEFTDRLDTVEQRILKRLDIIVVDNAEYKAALARDHAKFDSLDKSCVSIGKRIDDNAIDIQTNENNITKVRNINLGITALLSTIAGFIGTQR